MNYMNYRKTFMWFLLIGLILIGGLLILVFFPTSFAVRTVHAHDGHSHGRFGQITWVSATGDPANSVRITFTAGFRRDAYDVCKNPVTGASISCSGPSGRPGVGDIVLEDVGATTINNFGDGTYLSTVLYFKVFSINVDDNWLMARALQPGTANQEYIFHQYPGTGPYTIESASCCRTGPLTAPNAHINNPNKWYRFEAVVDFRTTASPISLLPPIVDCPKQTVCRFSVSAIDPDNPEEHNRRLSWALASPAEMGGADLIQPPNASINAQTGVYTFDTRGVTLGPAGYNTLYSTQVVIKDLDTSNNELSKVVLDFFIRIIDLPGPPEDVILIPVRWCGLRGSPSLENPLLLNMSSPSQVMYRRLQELNGDIYIPQANIMFISGARTGVYPMIDGPNPNGHLLAGVAALDRDRAINTCRLAWRDKDPAVTGILAINLNRFVDLVNGQQVPQTYPLGYADIPAINNPGEQLLRGLATVIDWAYLVENPDPNLPQPPPNAPDLLQKWFGHELGHGLSLQHSNSGTNLMQDSASRAIALDADQKARIRNQAFRYIPDRVIYPYPLQQNPPTMGSSWPDNAADVAASEAYVDVENTTIAVEQDTATTRLATSTFGQFPNNISNVNYFFSVDSDNNRTTGGNPSAVGVPGSSQGIELVGRVQVNVVSGTAQGVPTVWKFQNGQFVQISDPSISAVVNTLYESPGAASQTSSPTPKGQIIQLLLSNTVRGSIANNVNFDVAAQNASTGTVDTVQGSITFVPPTFPSCQAEPDSALLGSTINLAANSLPINQSVSVFLGTEQIATGTTNGSGSISLNVVIPTNTTTGTRQLSVNVNATAVAADCVIQLWSEPKFDIPPSPSSGNAFTVNVGQSLNFTVQASDADTQAGDVVTLGVIGLPTGAQFPIPAPASPAFTTFSWTPTIDQVGSYVVVFTAKDSLGLVGTPLSVTITVQSGPTACTPSNAYSSSQGSFHFATFRQSSSINFNRLPLSFVPNRGQENQPVRFQVQGLGGRLFFTPREVVFALPNPVKVKDDDKDRFRYDVHPANIVRIDFQGANPNPEIVGLGQLPGVVNVLRGDNSSRWQRNLPTYSGIAYRELYPGIELHYEGIDGQLKSTFQVAAGADPSAITWRYQGVRSISVDASGNLVLNLPEPAGVDTLLIEHAPIAWQGIGEIRVKVAVQYAVDQNGKKARFVFPNGYDSSLPLMIDPILSYSTYVGGGRTDQADAVTLDADCNIYLTGQTLSLDFPTVNPAQGNQPNSDVFVTKLSPAGNSILYSTYLGGNAADHALGISRDSQGRITLVGETESSNFPLMNAYDTSYATGTCENGDPCDDVFVTQLVANGSALRYSTYLGGSSDDEANGVAIGPDDKINLTGWTRSSTFPRPNGYDTSFGGGTCTGLPCEDVFVAKIDPALSGNASLLYGTFLGGNNYDKAKSIAVDASGHVYITGYTRSDTYPTLNPYRATRVGSSDSFITKLNPALSGSASLLYSSYFGGNESDHAFGIDVSGANQVYLTGFTQSTNLPLANPFDNTFGGGTCGSSACHDVFVIHLNIANNQLVFSSYLGGSHEDEGTGITADASGNAYITGYTKSTNFNTLAPIQASKATDSCTATPCPDAFVTKVSASGTLVYSTYLGGTAEDYGNAIVVDGLGNTYVVGHTFSSNLPGAINPFTGTAGFADAFVVKIDD